jgi:hypothetical protein
MEGASLSGNSRQVAHGLATEFNATAASVLPSQSVRGEISMKKGWFVLLLCSSSFLVAQDSNSSAMSQDSSKGSKGQVTVQGCVSRSSGDFVLIKQDPGITYELQATGKIKLSRYLGQRVEVNGTQSPSMSTSSDAARAQAPVTLTINSIKTINKECPVHEVSAQ